MDNNTHFGINSQMPDSWQPPPIQPHGQLRILAISPTGERLFLKNGDDDVPIHYVRIDVMMREIREAQLNLQV